MNVSKKLTRKSTKQLVLKKTYTEAPSITENKKRDLLSLCSVNLIPKAHHQFFLNLKSAKKVLPSANSDEET